MGDMRQASGRPGGLQNINPTDAVIGDVVVPERTMLIRTRHVDMQTHGCAVLSGFADEPPQTLRGRGIVGPLQAGAHLIPGGVAVVVAALGPADQADDLRNPAGQVVGLADHLKGLLEFAHNAVCRPGCPVETPDRRRTAPSTLSCPCGSFHPGWQLPDGQRSRASDPPVPQQGRPGLISDHDLRTHQRRPLHPLPWPPCVCLPGQAHAIGGVWGDGT